MTKYRGYYIDKVAFNSKAEIDEFIKIETIKKYQKYCRMFDKNPILNYKKIKILIDYCEKMY